MTATTLRAGPSGSAPAGGVRERQLLMKAPMVRATLDGRKTQTRRVMAVQPSGPTVVRDLWEDWPGGPAERPESSWRAFWRAESAERPGAFVDHSLRSPYGGPGDRLWVRETWGWNVFGGGPIDDEPEQREIVYRASRPTPLGLERWRPSIHMPRAFSRLTLEITDVRVQRVQEISEDDARAEGVEREAWPEDVTDEDSTLNAECGYFAPRSHAAAFAALWDSINAARGYGWDANPWVWALTFRRVEVAS